MSAELHIRQRRRGKQRSQVGYRSSSFSASSVTSKSSGLVLGRHRRGEQRPGAARSLSDNSHHSTHSDGTGSSSHDAFEWTDADYIAPGARLRELAQRTDSSSSTKAELAADTTRALADFAERPSPPRRSLDDVKARHPGG